MKSEGQDSESSPLLIHLEDTPSRSFGGPAPSGRGRGAADLSSCRRHHPLRGDLDPQRVGGCLTISSFSDRARRFRAGMPNQGEGPRLRCQHPGCSGPDLPAEVGDGFGSVPRRKAPLPARLAGPRQAEIGQQDQGRQAQPEMPQWRTVGLRVVGDPPATGASSVSRPGGHLRRPRCPPSGDRRRDPGRARASGSPPGGPPAGPEVLWESVTDRMAAP
jgi:hypothetical protein